MKLAKIPDAAIASLLRSLGLLIGQAGIYGPSHNVTQNAARAAFPELEQVVGQYGAVEITVREKKMLVNGVVLDVGGSAGRNLLDRMVLHKIEGIAFLSPANQDEFLQCVTLFGTPPMSLAAAGGFEEAMKLANLRSVQVVNVTYRRIAKDLAADRPDADRPAKPRAPRRPNATAVARILDLAATPGGIPEAEAATLTAPTAAIEEARRQAATVRQQRALALAELLRQAASLLEQNDAAISDDHQESVMAAFNQIRDTLSAMTSDSERQITTFAGQVNADRKTIADIETAARRRGIGLQLTRSELITRYAEISQEIAQPLTVSSGVIELLNSGHAGELSAAQRELLAMAAESVERVNRLVSHLQQISGMPETLTPDAAILKDAYQGP
ncbi:MAG: histidine kinase dimerization/phospho-acceptor domain-containing protein [bacterium]